MGLYHINNIISIFKNEENIKFEIKKEYGINKSEEFDYNILNFTNIKKLYSK